MPRSKKPKAELIRVAPQMDLEALDRLIQKRVAEAQASQGAILEPWFQTSRALAAEIRRHASMFHKKKFALYYDKWGCLVCGTKEKAHDNHGMCHNCDFKFVLRLKQLEKDYAKAHPQEYANQQTESLSSRIRNAERILRTARTESED
jgi:hypothetical protein